MQGIYQLWDQLDCLPPGTGDDALRSLALGIKSLLKVDNVKWMAAIRVLHGAKAKKDPMLGWRLRASYNLVDDPVKYQKLIAWLYHPDNRPDPHFQIGLATQALIAGAGKFRVHRMRDGWIDYAHFKASDHYRFHYTELGIKDRIWISFPLNADAESVFLLDRTKSKRAFLKEDALMAGTILRGIRGFHRKLFLNRCLPMGEKPLSPVLQRIVQKLLTGMSEREIAHAMKQSVPTTHKYIGDIYERFGVNGRAALMSLWLGS